MLAPRGNRGRPRVAWCSPVTSIVIALALLCVPGLVALSHLRTTSQLKSSSPPSPFGTVRRQLYRNASACTAWTRSAGSDIDDLVVHVSREVFPAAGFGGGGRVITGLLSAPSPNQLVIIPAYAFLFLPDHTAQYGMPAYCGDFSSDAASGGVSITAWALPVAVSPTVTRVALLLGPSEDSHPAWADIWNVGDVSSMYTQRGAATVADKDIWFAGAVQTALHAFIVPQQQAARRGRNPVPCDPWQCITVHAHGAMHAPALWFITESTRRSARPMLLYTMHDYMDEFGRQHPVAALSQGAAGYLASRVTELEAAAANERAVQDAPASLRTSSNVMIKPAEPIRRDEIPHGRWPSSRRVKSMYGTLLAVSMSDMATTVSKGMLHGMLDGSIGVPEAAAAGVRRAHRDHRIMPVLNGVDSALDPFRLPNTQPTFSDVTCGPHGDVARIIASTVQIHPVDVIVARKLAAKQALMSHAYGNEAGDRPLPLVVTFVGRLEQNKGATLLPGIIRSTCTDHGAATPSPKPLLFVVIGRVPEGVQSDAALQSAWSELLELQAAPTSTCTTILLPNASMVLTARLASDVTLVPSDHEAFGLVVAEAQSHGSVPVASAVGGVPDIIVHEPRAFLAASQVCVSASVSCDPAVLALRSDAAARMTSAATSWTGLLVPLISRNAVDFVAAMSAALLHVLPLLERMRSNERSALLQRLVASTPRWDAAYAALRCIRAHATRQRSQQLGGLVLAAAAAGGGGMVPDARWGPQLVPRWKRHSCDAREHLPGWTPSVHGYDVAAERVSSDVQITVVHMQLPPAGSVIASMMREQPPDIVLEDRRAGLVADVEFPRGGVRAALQVSGFARASRLQPGTSTSFCVYADAYYSDGGFLYGVAAPFAAGTHDWMMQTIEIAGSHGRKLTRVTLAFLLHVEGNVAVTMPSARLHFSL